MATLKQVAERAGVSSATVSKVLSNTPYVSEPTRQRVRRAIDELGYVPNLAARALASGRTYNIGVIFPYIYTSLFSDAQTLSLLEGVEAAASAHGYNILLSAPPMPVAQSEQYHRLVYSRYMDGVILLENLPHQSMSSLIAELGYPYVAIGYQSLPGETNTIHADDYHGAYAAARHLIDLGHRNIGLISIVEEDAMFSISERVRGWRVALAEAGIYLEDLPMAYGGYSIPSGIAAMEYLMNSKEIPSAILSINDQMALGAMQRARAAGLRIPEDIAFIGFDDIQMASHSDPPLSTVRQPSREMGERAAGMLFDMLTKKETVYDPVVMPTSLIVRGSSVPISVRR